jgi:ABC-type branched-subunit amino acid transport system substrate-binding protein
VGGRAGIALLAAVAVMLSACSSSSKSSSSTTTVGGSGGSAATHTVTVGVLADLTGISSNNTVSYPQGIKAGVGVAGTEGYNIKYVVADTGSSPAGVLAAAQKLVEQDHVFAILAYSAFAFSAAPFLASKGIPVIGSAVDSSEWITNKNMFSVFGTADFTKVWTQTGLFFKLVGVSNLATLGYSISPSSWASAKSAGVSAQAQGIKVGYLNANFPYGTNTAPVVLGMKSAGVNGFDGAVQTNTAIAIVQDARQEGLNLKAALMATGYGGDLVQGGPGAQQAAQGVYFSTSQEPVEMNTPATKEFQSASPPTPESPAPPPSPSTRATWQSSLS